MSDKSKSPVQQDFKKCPKCGGFVFKTTTKCYLCGHEFISTDCSGEILEKRAASLFEMAGWEVVATNDPPKSYYHDLVLSYNGTVVGFVEIFKNLTKEKMLHKIMQFKKCVIEEKPKIAILTNLHTFFVSYCGKPFEELKHAPTPFEGDFFADHIKECLEEITKKTGDDSNDN